jgi:hypothetical protein
MTEGLMAGRQIRSEEGGVFQLQRYVWRSAPATCSLPGGAIRCIVGQDEHGTFRPGIRLGRSPDGGKAQTIFTDDQFLTKEEAVQASREMTRAYIWAEAECYADSVKKSMKPGERIIKVQMDDGWSVQINAPGKLSPLEEKLVEMAERSMADGKTQPSSRGRSYDLDR